MSDPGYDAIVVGGRCAGAATALLLARRGYRVAVLERSRFPSDTLSTHGLARGGVVQLQRWGLLPAVLASGTPAVRKIVFRLGDAEEIRTIKHRAGVDLLVAPRRYVLDQILADAASEAGAQFLFGTTAVGVLDDPSGRITGVVARTGDGTTQQWRARVVVGADGLRSRFADWVGARYLRRERPDSTAFYGYVDGLTERGYEFHAADRSLAGIFPTHDGQACVWVCGPAALARGLRGASVEAFIARLGLASPSLAQRVRSAGPVSPIRGAIGLPNQIRAATGPGWVLVGDAGYHRDPITGHGITDAFRDADLAAAAIDDHLRGQAPDLSGFAAARDAAIAEIYDITCAMTRYPPVDQFVALQRRLSRALDVEAQMLASLPIPMTI